jgi:hypothetical protein
MPDDLESKTAIALVASLMRQLQMKNVFGERDIRALIQSTTGLTTPDTTCLSRFIRAARHVA